MAKATGSDDEEDFEKISMQSFSTCDFSLVYNDTPTANQKNSIFVTNLPDNVQEYELFEKFRNFGKLAEPGIELNIVGKRKVCHIYYNDSATVESILNENPVIIMKGFKLAINASPMDVGKMPNEKFFSDSDLLKFAELTLDRGGSSQDKIKFPDKENISRNFQNSKFKELSNGVCSIWVGNVPYNVSLEELAAKFTAFGKLATPCVHKYPSRNKSCCYAFVNFVSPLSVEKIFTVNPKIILKGSLLELRRSNSKQDLSQNANVAEASTFAGNVLDQSNESNNAAECRSLYVGNLPKDATSRQMYPIFASYGKLNVPGITIYNSKKSDTCYAFVNFVAKESACKVLARCQDPSKPPFMFRGLRLSIKRSTSEHDPDTIVDTLSSHSGSSDNIPANLQYYMLHASNLPKDIARKEVFNIFKDFGRICEPPGLQVVERDRLAKVPFCYLKDAENLMRRFKGRLPIRHETVLLILNRAYESAIPSNNPPQKTVSKQETSSKAKPLVAPRPSLEHQKSKTVQQPKTIDPKFQSVFKWTEQNVVPSGGSGGGDNAAQQPAVQIRNVSNLSSENLLRQYLENGRRSNGGKVVKFVFEKEYDRATAVFENMNILDNVLNKPDHTLDDCQLYISKLPPISYSRLYFENIPEWVGLDRLKDFLEARSHCSIKQVQFREDDKGAIVDFEEDQIVDQLKQECAKRPLKEGDHEMNFSQLKISPVVYPDAVLVYGKIPSKDSVMLAFEDMLNKDASEFQSAVRYVLPKPERSMTLVIFEDSEAVSCLNGDSIVINEEKFRFAPFYDFLGWVPQKGKANFLREHGSTMVRKTLTQLQVKFLNSVGGKLYVKSEVEKLNVFFHHSVDDQKNTLNVTAGNQALSEHYALMILSCMKTVDLELDASMLKTWNENSASFLSRLDDSDVKNYFCHTLTTSTLTILTANNEINIIKAKVVDFFDNSSTYEECLLEPCLFGRFLKKYHETDLKLKCNHNKMSLCFLQDGRLMVSGTKSQIGLIGTDIHIIMSDIEEAEYNVNRPGMSNYLRSYLGLADLAGIAERTHTVILTEDEIAESWSLPASVGKLSLVPNGTNLDGLLNGTIKLKVIHGDMTLQNVDAIVNAANEDLDHIGGLALAIVEAGGKEIQTECKNYVKLNGKLKVGQVFVSKSGKLPCKHIVHVVGPRFQNGRNNEDLNLKNSITNILKEAESRNMQSVAIPAVSTSVFGYPLDKAIPIIVNTIDTASRGLLHLNDIRLVDNRMEVITRFVNEIRKIGTFVESSGVAATTPGSGNAVAMSPNILFKPVPILPILSNNFVAFQPAAAAAAASPSVKPRLSVNGCRIKVIKADIVTVAKTCDVIVNTTSASNLLGGSASCNAITNAAGQAYSDCVKLQYPNGLHGQPLAVTIAGQLGCKGVFHIACGGAWNAATSPQTVYDNVFSCLNELRTRKWRSIAFPAMGTGGLKYPGNLVAQSMFNAADAWLKAVPFNSVDTVYFVVFPTDLVTVQHFKNEYKTRLGLPLNPQPSPAVASWHARVMPNMGAAAHVGHNACTIGQITVEIVEGNIVQEKTDGIVCPTNKELDLSQGQVSIALLKAGGKQFRNLIDVYKNDFKKDVLPVLCPGILACNCVLFIDAPTNANRWEDVFTSALKEADRLNLKSIAVPSLGTGQIGRNVSEVADMMIQTIQDFASRNRSKENLRLIRIVIFQKSSYGLFCQRLSTLIARGETKSSNISRFSKMYRLIADKLDLDFPLTKNVPVKAQKAEQSLRLCICGSFQAVKDAQAKLDKFCDDKCPQRTICKEIIGQLDDQVIELLESKAEVFGVRMFTNKMQNKIKIEGVNVQDFLHYVSEFIDRLKEETVDVNVKWYKRAHVTSAWQPVESGLVRLEKAFNNAQAKPCLNMEFENEGEVFVDFNNMRVLSKKRDVLFHLKRKESSDSIPVEWDWDGQSSEDYKLVPLDPNSAEFLAVSNDVMRTVALNIEKIERVENPVKYKQYLVLKEKMEKALAQGQVVERKLYHGTDPSKIPGICRTGFNRSLAGQNGTVYGHGSYFARDCKYSCGYGKTTIFYASVLTGSIAQGHQELKLAPDLDASKGIKYDSVVDNVSNPSIFVVFSDNHAYPYYLITYK